MPFWLNWIELWISAPAVTGSNPVKGTKTINLEVVLKKVLWLAFSSFIFSSNIVDTVWIDASISKMNWIGYKITGSHDGHIKIENGYVLKDKNLIVGGEIVVDMQSISVDDIKDSGKNEYLTSHLKNEDFFNVEKFPKAHLKILSSKEIFSKDMANSNLQMSAELTIKDITNEILIYSNVDFDRNISMGQLIVDRTKWNIKYGSNSFYDLGDRAIYDDFVINFLLFPKR